MGAVHRLQVVITGLEFQAIPERILDHIVYCNSHRHGCDHDRHHVKRDARPSHRAKNKKHGERRRHHREQRQAQRAEEAEEHQQDNPQDPIKSLYLRVKEALEQVVEKNKETRNARLFLR